MHPCLQAGVSDASDAREGDGGAVALRQGRLSPRVLALIVEWAQHHQAELLDNWDRLQRGQPPLPVPPLE